VQRETDAAKRAEAEPVPLGPFCRLSVPLLSIVTFLSDSLVPFLHPSVPLFRLSTPFFRLPMPSFRLNLYSVSPYLSFVSYTFVPSLYTFIPSLYTFIMSLYTHRARIGGVNQRPAQGAVGHRGNGVELAHVLREHR